jgi:uncharacterized protein (TIGR00252 family)
MWGRYMNTRKLGQAKEAEAFRYLEGLGYLVVAVNWRWSNRGEIDIVVKDPNRYGREYWVFVEVKYRQHSMAMSLQAMNQKKIIQIKKLAQMFLLERGVDINYANISFDFIAIHGKQILHIQDIVK